MFLTPEGWEHREFLLDHLFSTVSSLTGLPHESIHIAGSTVDSISVDRASKKYMDEMLVASYILSFILMYGVFRSTILAAMVFVDSYFCQQISLALIYITGAEMDSVMLIVPSLVYVLAVSTGVHLISYYRNALTSVAANEASRTALRHAIVPCTLSTTTTAVGLISLMVSSLVPVDKFAFYAALGVVVSTTTLFLIVPSQLELISRLKNAKQRFCSSEGSRGRWQSLRDRVGNARHPIFIVTAIIFVVSLTGITKLKSSAGIHDQFRASEKIIQDYQWFEESLGPLVPIEVVLRLPKRDGDNSMSMADRLRYVAVAHNLVGRQEEIGAVVSAASFSPTMKRRRRGASAVAKESVLNKELEKHSGRYVDMSLLQYTEEEELWRISARSYATRKIDYDRILANLRDGLEKITQKFESQEHKDASAVVCGGVPLVRKTQRQMLIDLKEGFMVAVALITAMMIALAISSASHELHTLSSLPEKSVLLLSRVGAGCVAMIPNVLPCIAMFGAMGMAEVPMDIGSLLTASVALGIAVDDTLHFISWVYRSLANGLNSRRSCVACLSTLWTCNDTNIFNLWIRFTRICV